MDNKFYITTAIAYTSKKPHIGNTYEIVLTDAIARYKRKRGYDVFFLTGTDEHGQKIEEIANELAITPKQHVDTVSGDVRRIWDLMDSSYDKFIRTTDTYHEKTVQKIFKKLYEQGDIYKGEYSGHYCVPCESFFTDTQVEGGCCPDCGRIVKPAKEEAYFFKMSAYQDRLTKHIQDNPNFITPESRKREMVNNFLKPGLQDLCVSRTSFKWGIPVDFDSNHVVYVWLDALTNYISALGYDPDGSGDLYKKYWPADLHVIGKDILRFHTIYWPIFLMALNEPLPKQILGHPWLLSGQDKMSKSTGNVIYADDLVEHFGVDAVRYYLLSEMPYAQDGNITYENIIVRYNTDLANTLGNLVNRTVAMVNKYYDGAIFAPTATQPLDSELSDCALNSAKEFKKAMDEYKTVDATDAIMTLARRSNKYIDETMPWALAKDEDKSERLKTVLYNLLESIRFIALLLSPIMPTTATAICEQIGATITDFDTLDSFGHTEAGTSVSTPTPLFNRIDETKKLEEIEKSLGLSITNTKKAPEKVKTPAKQEAPEGVAIGIEDFAKVSLKVAQIKKCVKVEKSDKLLKLILDDGEGERQVVSGIAAWYTPDDLIDKKVIVVANLRPAKLRGEISNGMILAADSGDAAKVIFVDDSISPGSKIR